MCAFVEFSIRLPRAGAAAVSDFISRLSLIHFSITYFNTKCTTRGSARDFRDDIAARRVPAANLPCGIHINVLDWAGFFNGRPVRGLWPRGPRASIIILQMIREWKLIFFRSKLNFHQTNRKKFLYTKSKNFARAFNFNYYLDILLFLRLRRSH